MGALEDVIDSISSSQGEKLPVRNRDMLLAALHELQSLVGLKRLKESVGLQCMQLLRHLQDGTPCVDKLNTVIYGPPGVGKTTVGKILAKIWYGLGFLKPGPNVEDTEGFPAVKPFQVNTKNGYLGALFMMLFWIALFLIMLSYTVKSIGWIGLVLALLSIITLTFLDRKSGHSEAVDVNVPNRDSDDVNPDNLATLAGREDFVGGYLGQSALKTKAFLEKNRGRVILVDEAYTLLESPSDQFGKEAVGVLLKYMTEYPESTCLIFMGYQDDIKNGPFALNKGLERRFTWHFNCDGYNAEDMWTMFKQQLAKKKLLIMDKYRGKIKREFFKHVPIFTKFGGDMERLSYFIELEVVKEIYMESQAEKVFGIDHFRQGLRQLSINNI